MKGLLLDPGSFALGIFCGVLLTGITAVFWPEPIAEIPGPPPPLLYVQKIRVVTTGYYCPAGGRSNQCDKGTDDGKTATNTRVRKGVCASDWRVFPTGTQFAVPHYGACRVEDRGSHITGLHLDLYFTNLEEAKQWGRRELSVWLLPSGLPAL